MPYIEIIDSKQRNDFERVFKMQVCNDDGTEATDLVNNIVVERFGRPRIYRGMLRDQDLVPRYSIAHQGRASYVEGQFDTGDAGKFTIRADGTFLDFHGGNGLGTARSDGNMAWFTPEAKRRGIGWWFTQVYRMNNRRIGMFHVIRIFRRGNPYRLEVIKRPA